MVKASVFLARYLKSQGVARAFGLPGGEAVPLIEGLRQEGIPFILTHHEAAAGVMAGTTGAITGVPGLCIATIGPGAVNMVSAVAMAYLDRLPMVAISGDAEPCHGGRFSHQCLDLVRLFEPITKFSKQLTAESITRDFPEAFELARSGRPGPVYFAMSASEAGSEVPGLEDMDVDEIGKRFGVEALPLPAANVAPVVTALREAESPVMMVGLGVLSAGPADLVGLAERARMPVMVTPQAKGFFPEDHPLFAGVFGLYTDAPLHDLIKESDLMLAVGLDGVEFFNPWTLGIPVVSIASACPDDPAYEPGLAVEGDLAAIVEQLRLGVLPSRAWSPERIARCRDAVAATMAPHFGETEGRVAPQVVVAELRKALPRDGILTVDVGAHKLVACAQWPSYEPGTFLTTNGLSSMGYAVSAALAAALSHPHPPVAALTGDGGFLMYTGEMETLSRLGVPVVVVVLNDGSLSSIKVKQEKRSLKPAGVEFNEPDYLSLAAAFGLLGFRATTREECREAFAEALGSGRGAIVEVVTSYEEYLKYQ